MRLSSTDMTKRLKILTYALLLAVFLAVGCGALCFLTSNEAYAEYNSYGFEEMETLDYKVDVSVNDNKSYDVTETISVNFNLRSRGIVRNIPEEGYLYRGDGNGKQIKEKYIARITNISVDEEYSVSSQTHAEGKDRIIRIGDPDKYITGERTYVLRYTVYPGNDTRNGDDEFYINIFPVKWDSTIQNGSFSIVFPAEFEGEPTFYTGGDIAESNVLTFVKEGVKISGTLTAPLHSNNGISIRQILPDKYFTADYTQYIMLGVGVGIGIISLIVAFLLWHKYGRDEKPIPVITFYPPKDMTSADVGYVIDGVVDDKDIISMIIYWADKGYLSIKDEGKGDNPVLVKLADLPPESREFEKTTFYGIFPASSQIGSEVALSSLEGKFYSNLTKAKTQLRADYASEGKRIYTPKSLLAEKIGFVLSIIAIFAGAFCVLYRMDSIMYTLFTSLICTGLIGLGISSILKGISLRKNGKLLSMVLMGAVLIGLAFIWLMLNSFLTPLYIGVFVVILALAAGTMALGMLSRKRTDEAVKWQGEILGLKDFIEKTEKDRIEKLVQDDPSYFYKVLPYAYALGVTDTWSKKFESIAVPPPVWYTGSGMDTFSTILFITYLNRSITSMSRAMVTRPQSRGGRGGFGSGGGGFSVGSGGGFSGGGGFGGGGGGRW